LHIHILHFKTMVELTEELQERVDIIRHKLKFIEQKPTVACIETLEPLTLAAHDIPELVSIAGGAVVLAEANKPSLQVQWEQIQQIDPDIIILMPSGFSIERSIKEADLLLQLPGFMELKAVKNSRLYIADGSQYFYNANHIVDAIEILAEIINPKQFIFGYEGEGWIKFGV
jgi:iron complex transport system substrate-binding protein